MNAIFDLDISNYSKPEMEELLGLPSNYDETIIEMKETKLRNNILNDNSISSTIKTNTLGFIKNVKNILINTYKTPINEQNNTDAKTNADLSIPRTYFNKNDLGITKSEINEQGSAVLITQPKTHFFQSNQSEFYPGLLNPLNNRILRQNINIDTRFRENYYTSQSTNIHLDLPARLTQVVSLQLSALELPTSSIYAISKAFGNNFFVIEIDGLTPLNIIIPDGNYSYLDLQDYINNYLVTVVENSDYNLIQFVIDFNGTTGSGSVKMIVGSLNGNIPFSLNFQTDINGSVDTQTPLPLKFGWMLGFRQGQYVNAEKYVSEGVVDLTGPKYIYLSVDDFNNNVSDGFQGVFTASVLNKNILARIALQNNVFSQNNTNVITTPRHYFGQVDIQKLQIQLLDEYGRILDLSNMDYSFCLTFQTIYDL